MEILRSSENDALVLALTGRLDAAWAGPVQAAIDAAIRDGEHRLVLDLAGVDYISSAGLRVVIAGYKQLRAIDGAFLVRAAQPGVAKVIELSGLAMLLATPVPAAAKPEAADRFESASAAWERHGTPAPVSLRAVGGASAFDASGGAECEFPPARFALGVGAFAATREQAAPRLGEFLAAGGCAAHLPADGANRPDFLFAEQALVPSAWISSGLVIDGAPALLLRFETRRDCRAVPLAEIAGQVLAAAGAPAAAFVVAAEAAGLVGAALRRPPAAEGGDPFAFPGIRDRLNFTSERSFRDSTVVMTGVVARPGAAWEPWLRPMSPAREVFGHVHAAVFSYRPIRKGAIALEETVRDFFETGGLQTLLHLLNDTREPDGSGDSEFRRGACWVAPLANEP